MAERKRSVVDAVSAFPVLVSPLNCEAVCGDKWRHISEWAHDRGVTIYQLGKPRWPEMALSHPSTARTVPSTPRAHPREKRATV